MATPPMALIRRGQAEAELPRGRRLRRADGDTVEENAEYHYEPDCVDWGVCV